MRSSARGATDFLGLEGWALHGLPSFGALRRGPSEDFGFCWACGAEFWSKGYKGYESYRVYKGYKGLESGV